jgi:CPA1 family monovalent cation:H+ antiporter
MRGVVSLALALALPSLISPDMPAGAQDPRMRIIVITFIVIVATLVLQGLTLLPLVARLGAGDPEREARDERKSRERARDAGLRLLQQVSRDDPAQRSICESAAAAVQSGELGIASNHIASAAAARTLGNVLDAQRHVVVRLRDDGEIGEALAERLNTELDVDAMRLSGEVARLTGPE